MTDFERAARFRYLLRLAFGGEMTGRTFGIDTTGGARFKPAGDAVGCREDQSVSAKHVEAPLMHFGRLGATKLFVAVLLVLALGIGAGWQLRGVEAKADEDAVATAQNEIDRFLQALSGNGALKDVLGEAFQLFRSNGQRFDRAAYLSTPSSLTRYAVDSVEAIEADGVLTATFLVSATGEVDDVERETVGLPHIAVFSKVDGAWKLQAWASLGELPATGR